MHVFCSLAQVDVLEVTDVHKGFLCEVKLLG